MLEKLKNIFRLNKSVEKELSIEDKIEELFSSLNSDTITLLVGNDFIDYSESILKIVDKTRNEIKDTNGFILPLVHIKSSDSLQENEVLFKVREKEVLQKFILPNEKNLIKEIKAGLKELYKEHLHDIFSCETTEKYVTQVQKQCPWMIWNITSIYSITEIRDVLVEILQKDKSIKNINYVFEKFSEYTLDAEFYKHREPNIIADKISSFL